MARDDGRKPPGSDPNGLTAGRDPRQQLEAVDEVKTAMEETVRALAAGEIGVDEAIERVDELVTETVSEAVSSIEVVDAYAMSAISALGGAGDPDDIAERAFSIAASCLRERGRCIRELLPDEETVDDGGESDDA